jgi:hypothetical protein
MTRGNEYAEGAAGNIETGCHAKRNPVASGDDPSAGFWFEIDRFFRVP